MLFVVVLACVALGNFALPYLRRVVRAVGVVLDDLLRRFIDWRNAAPAKKPPAGLVVAASMSALKGQGIDTGNVDILDYAQISQRLAASSPQVNHAPSEPRSSPPLLADDAIEA